MFIGEASSFGQGWFSMVKQVVAVNGARRQWSLRVRHFGDSPKDVEHLHEKRIIAHQFGSEEDVATLFNNLRKEIVFDTSDYYLLDVSQKLNKHYQQKWRTWKAIFKHEYLKDPWKIISLVAASFLILLTLAQTAYTIISYHVPKH
ncbi:hypothetical protein ACSBR2_041708 [Camellia fascicularis]